jgi:hypothetical protein
MRRMFWVSVGAIIGVTGYRRATALARSLRPRPPQGSLDGFAADVREGMALYMDRQAARAPANLEGHPRRSLGPAGTRHTPRNPRRATSRNDELKDGR